MDIRTHIQIGRLLHAHLQDHGGETLHRTAFLYGNVKPDLPRSALLPGRHVPAGLAHYQNDSLHTVSCWLKQAMQPAPERPLACADESATLGVLTHFFSDYFCFAHRSERTESLVGHLRYERDLSRYLARNPDRFTGTVRFGALPRFASATDVLGYFHQLQSRFRKKKPSFDLDLQYALKFCLVMLDAVCRARRSAGAAEELRWSA